MKVTLLNEKTIEVEFRNNRSIRILNSYFELRKMGDEFVLKTTSASKEMAEYFSAKIEKQTVSLRIAESVYSDLQIEFESFNQRNEAEKEEKRNEYIAARPQKLVVMFSGWYLSDTPQIVTMFEKEDGEKFKDKTNRWYVAKTHYYLSEIKISDALAMGLQDAPFSTDFESRCFIVSEEQAKEINNLDKSRKSEKENVKQKAINDENEKKNALIMQAKSTGEKQILSQYMDECDGKVPDCSFDQIITWIDQYGEITSSRSHCH